MILSMSTRCLPAARPLTPAACLLIAATTWTLGAGPASATEGDNQHYPVGVNSVSDGTLPPPGMLQLLSYTAYSQSSKLSDGSGNKAVPQFGLDVEAEAPLFRYTWEPEIGPFHYTTGFVVPITHVESNVVGTHGRVARFGDIDLQDYLGYASPDGSLFYFFGLDVYMPTGNYAPDRGTNLGLNYWTFMPSAAVTWNPSPRLELTGALFFGNNTENNATHYQSGRDVDLDWGVTYRPLTSLPKFGVGLNGYIYKQYTADKQYGLSVADGGNRGQEFTIGPQFRYDWDFGGLVLKYTRSVEARNRAGGNHFWLQVALPLYGRPAAR